MSSVPPQVPKAWHFIPCDRVDRVGGSYSLNRVKLVFANPLGQSPPRVYPELWLYAALSDGTGTHQLQVQMTCLRDQTRVFRWPARVVDFGDDPTEIHEIPFQLDYIVFWTDGQCEFNLYCGGRRLATAVVDVR